MAATASTTRKRKSTRKRKPAVKKPVVVPQAPVQQAPVQQAANGLDQKATDLAAREAALLAREVDLAKREAVAEAIAAAPAPEQPKGPIVLPRVTYRSRKRKNLQIGRMPRDEFRTVGGKTSSVRVTPPPFQFKDHQLVLKDPEQIAELDFKLLNDDILKNEAYKVTSDMQDLLAQKAGKVTGAVAMRSEKDVHTPAELIQRAIDENDFPVVELQKLHKPEQKQEFIIEWFAKQRRTVFPELMTMER